MPQLPSGRRFALSVNRALELADNFRVDKLMVLGNPSGCGVLYVLDVLYYDKAPDPDNPDDLGNIFYPGLSAADVLSDKCDWPIEDKKFYVDWLQSEVARKWIARSQIEINERLKNAKCPESLRGILDDDY